MCFTLASCSKSIGIIGGADGETDIYVEETRNTQNACTPLLYKATDNNGNVAWLFGAIHIGREDFYPLPSYVMDAFNSSEALAVEVDSANFEKGLAYIKYVDKTTVKDHIDEQLYNRAREILEENGKLGEISDSYMPSAWSLFIDKCTYSKLGFEERYGVDNYLLDLAKHCDKEVLEVEGDEKHAKSLAELSDKVQEMMLSNSISQYSNSDRAKCSFNMLLDIWAEGNEQEMCSMINAEPQFESEEQKELYEEYNKAMSEDRNDMMTVYIKDAMKDKKQLFVCVGQAHIIGEGAIITQLREQGYLVELVK